MLSRWTDSLAGSFHVLVVLTYWMIVWALGALALFMIGLGAYLAASHYLG